MCLDILIMRFVGVLNTSFDSTSETEGLLDHPDLQFLSLWN